MRRWCLLLVLSVILAGCSGPHPAPVADGKSTAQARVDHKRAASMAYEHAVTLEIPAGHTRQTTEAVRQACAALPDQGCTVLESSVRNGFSADATVRMRVTPDGVNKVLAALDGRGKVVSQSSKGEDLAEPIEDAERKMAMLTGYRDQLLGLTRQRALEPEAVIKLHRELAQVQSEIDGAATSRAQLHRRVQTELLTVAMHEPARRGHEGKVEQALQDFGDDFLQGVAMLITFVASTIPFALAGGIGYLFWRRIRAARRKAKASPKQG